VKNNRPQTAKAIPVKLDPVLMERIEVVSKRMGEARSTVMRIAMRLGLEGLENAFQTGEITAEDLRAAVYPEHKPDVALAADAGKVDIEKLADEAGESESRGIITGAAGSAHTAGKGAPGAPSVPAPRRTPAPAPEKAGSGISYRTPSKRKSKPSGGK
jgi:ParB-like chromosome segregation protein Spo0J